MLPLKIQNGVGDARKEEIPRGLTTSRKQQIVFNLFQVFVVEFLGMVEVDMLLTPKSRSYHLGSDFRLRQVRQGITLCAEELFFPWSVMGSQALLHGLGTQALGEIEPDPSAVFHSVCFHPSPSVEILWCEANMYYGWNTTPTVRWFVFFDRLPQTGRMISSLGSRRNFGLRVHVSCHCPKLSIEQRKVEKKTAGL